MLINLYKIKSLEMILICTFYLPKGAHSHQLSSSFGFVGLISLQFLCNTDFTTEIGLLDI